MRFGVDIDGVVADFAAAADEWLRRNAMPRYQSHPIDEWNWFRKYPNGDALWKRLWAGPIRHSGFLRDKLAPVKGAVEALTFLASEGVDIVYITHRPEWTFGDTVAWLAKHGVLHPVYHVEDKTKVPCDLYVDDKPENIREYIAAGRSAVLFDQPWNQGTLPSLRAEGWLDVVAEVSAQRYLTRAA